MTPSSFIYVALTIERADRPAFPTATPRRKIGVSTWAAAALRAAQHVVVG